MREMHGMTGTAIYARWKTMKRRTSKVNATGFKNYGGRGIKMCEEWSNSFMAFFQYIGNPPGQKFTIERIDNDKGYEPGNVRWATYAENLANQRPRLSRHGIPGVRRTKSTWWAMIQDRGRRIYLGSFNTAEEASAAYRKAKTKYVLSIATIPT